MSGSSVPVCWPSDPMSPCLHSKAHLQDCFFLLCLSEVPPHQSRFAFWAGRGAVEWKKILCELGSVKFTPFGSSPSS